MNVKKRTVSALKKQIEASKRRIAKERDLLRDYISEVEEIAENCDEAVDDLERAADALSDLL